MTEVFRLGLEGLVLKDLMVSKYKHKLKLRVNVYMKCHLSYLFIKQINLKNESTSFQFCLIYITFTRLKSPNFWKFHKKILILAMQDEFFYN